METNNFKVILELQVRFRDTDAMGHINNAVYLSYLELARIEYWVRLTGERNYKGVNFILARVQIDYRSPGKIDDFLVVGVRLVSLGGASFDFEYRIWDKATGRLVAEAKTTQVMYDYQKGRPVRMPIEFKEKIRAFERGNG